MKSIVVYLFKQRLHYTFIFLAITCSSIVHAADALELTGRVEWFFNQAATKAKTDTAHAYSYYGAATAQVANVAATLPQDQRTILIDALGNKLKNLFRLETVQAASDGSAETLIAKIFAQAGADYGKAASTIITETMLQMRTNRAVQKALVDALCSYLKKIFEIQTTVTNLLQSPGNGSWQQSVPHYAQASYDIVMAYIQPEQPLQSNLAINALCSALIQKHG